MPIHGITVLSNHYHLLISPEQPDHLVRFMHFVQTNLSKEIGDLHDWTGSLWDRRYRHVPVTEETAAQISRLGYLLENSVKEDLVARTTDWPGVHCAQALLDGQAMKGVWYDRTAFYEARRRGDRVDLEDFAEQESVVLSPLPCWRGLEEEEIRSHLSALIKAIEQRNAERRRAEGKGVLGAKTVRRRHPHARPEKLDRSSAPRFHAATKAMWRQLRDGYNAFFAAFHEEAERLRCGEVELEFPPGSFPPGLPYVPHQAPG